MIIANANLNSTKISITAFLVSRLFNVIVLGNDKMDNNKERINLLNTKMRKMAHVIN